MITQYSIRSSQSDIETVWVASILTLQKPEGTMTDHDILNKS